MLQPKEIYTRRISVLNFGYPLFSPCNVQLGDVGFIRRSDGSFQLLYNIAHPDTNLPGHPPPLTLVSGEPDLTEWQAIHMHGKSRRKIEVSIQPPAAEGNANFEFSKVDGGDVILVPGEAVRSDNLRGEGELKKYFERHFRWMAETYCPKEDILPNELVLVHGTTKTNRWAMAVNVDERVAAKLTFNVRGSGVGAWGEWSGSVGFQKYGPQGATSDDEPKETIFIHRIKMRGIRGKIETSNEPDWLKRLFQRKK